MKKILWLTPPFILFIVFFPFLLSTLGKPLLEKHLSEKFNAKITLASARLTWLGPQKFNGVRFVQGETQGAIEQIETYQPLGMATRSFTLQNGSLATPAGTIEKIQGKVADQAIDVTGVAEGGSLSLQGNVRGKDHFDLELDFQNLPAPSLLEVFLGPTFSLKGNASSQGGKGNLDLTLTSSQAFTHFTGVLSPHGLTLESPLSLQFTLTPSLSKLFLREVNPLFLTALSAKQKISLTIEPENFFLPLFPLNWEGLQIGHAALDLGQVTCQIGPSLATLLDFLKLRTSSSQIDVWFAPLSFSLSKGVLESKRMDFLLNRSIHLCIWGSVDLLSDRLRMTLGIPKDTLYHSFRIQTLADDYVLKIPIRGSVKDPNLVKGPAAAKIAALIAGQEASKKAGLFGDLVKTFVKVPPDEDVPPPQRPFPWER